MPALNEISCTPGERKKVIYQPASRGASAIRSRPFTVDWCEYRV